MNGEEPLIIYEEASLSKIDTSRSGPCKDDGMNGRSFTSEEEPVNLRPKQVFSNQVEFGSLEDLSE